jgi:hypothetical protein
LGFDASGLPLDNVVGGNLLSFTVRTTAVPEPTSMVLMGSPALAAAAWVLARGHRSRAA